MKFNYQARTKEEKTQTGIIEAGSRESAIEILQRLDLVVIFLEKTSAIPFYARTLKIFQKVKVKELTLFYRQLSILFEANVSPLDSLGILAKQIINPLFKEVILQVEGDVKGGESLSQALGKHPKVFFSFYVNVVKAGEATGNLSDVLKYLADHAEREYNLTSKVKGAFTYPIAIFAMFLVVGTLMMIFVVPQLTSMIQELGQELPMPTRVLIFVSNILRSWLWLVVLIIIGLVVAIGRFVRTPNGRFILDTAKLKIPIFGELFKKIYLARFSENLRTLLKGGISILKALEITGAVIGNKIYENIIKEAREKVRIGETISIALSNYPKEIPPMVTQMVSVGEKTAQLDIILDKVANFYQQDVDRMVNNMTQLIEPIMILILGGGVGFLITSILMPIYNMTSGM
ncbi:type II secretion system F family protein [Patescibacteria group bacterium]|nr:type II secretion system F family protein [Patescibacteria group bacterium]MBU4458409.1 type II secretion system F family protein [Patescibacteria group bacterium]MCG2695836.1 type II secretion system F family protein [Candidatus Portnoybacteria bacterium]